MTSFFAESRSRAAALIATIAAVPTLAAAQSIAQRVAAANGPIQVVYPSRPSACGDGTSNIQHVLDDHGNDGWSNRPCVHGPARVVATVIDGEVTRLRAYVGPVPRSGMATIDATAADAAAWLSSLVTHENSRVASSAILPLVLADAPDPWPLLLRVARDGDQGQSVRREALMWLGMGAVEHLGIEQAGADSPDDEMRTQAVFALSRRPRAESVPTLIDLARSAKYPSAKRSAIFWLGQTGDPRAADVFAQLLGLR